jgi:hypothetical protein
MHYYILKDKSLVESSWQKQPGDVHTQSTVEFVITKEIYDGIRKELVSRHNREVRKQNKMANIWLAGAILNSGRNVGLDINDTLAAMKDLAPASYKAIKMK